MTTSESNGTNDQIPRLETLTFGFLLLFISVLPIRHSFVLADSITIGKILGLLVFSLWALKILFTKEVRKPNSTIISAFLLAILGLISFIWSPVGLFSYSKLLGLIYLPAFALLFWDLCEAEERLWYIQISFFVGFLLLLASAFINGFLGNTTFHGRVNTALGGPGAAVFFPFLLIFGSHLAFQKDNHYNDMYKITFIILLFILSTSGIILAAKKTGVILLIPASIYIVYNLFTHKHITTFIILWIAPFILIGLIFLAVITPEFLIDRILETPYSIMNLQLTGRVPRWVAGIELWQEHPIKGLGIGGYSVQSVDLLSQSGIYSIHNTHLSVLVNLGLIGFLIYFMFLTFIARMVISNGNHRLFLLSLLSMWLLYAMVQYSLGPITAALFGFIISASVIYNE